MSFNANNLPKTKIRPPLLDAGAYPARIAQVIVLGIQPQRPFKGEDKAPTLEIMLTYELLDEFLKDENGEDNPEKPRFFSENFPFRRLDSERAKSTKRYLALDPTNEYEGDFSKLLNTPCIVTLTKDLKDPKDKTVGYNNISNVSTMREKEAAKAPKLVNKPVVFDFYEPDPLVFDSLQDWIKDKIKGAIDYEDVKNGNIPSVDEEGETNEIDDEIPY